MGQYNDLNDIEGKPAWAAFCMFSDQKSYELFEKQKFSLLLRQKDRKKLPNH